MANMSYYLTQDFPKNLSINIGARYSFKNYKKIEEWCASEVRFYQAVGVPHMGRLFDRDIIKQILAKFNQIRNTEITWNDFSNELKTFIEEAFNSHRFISSRSKEGKFLSRLHTKNPKLISGALLHNPVKTDSHSAGMRTVVPN